MVYKYSLIDFPEFTMYAVVYACTLLVLAISSVVKAIVFVKASINLHKYSRGDGNCQLPR